jgi:hypothetical protein
MNTVHAASVNIADIFSPAKSFPTIGSFITVFVTNATMLAGLLAFVFIILGGFAILTGSGDSDPKKIEQGKKTLTMALVGLLVVVFAIWILQAFKLFLGFDPLNPPGTQ